MDLPNSLETGAIVVSGELGVFNECALLDEVPEALGGHKVVVLAVDLAGARVAGCICSYLVRKRETTRQKHTGDAEPKLVRELGEQALEQGALADAGGPREDKGTQEVGAGRHACNAAEHAENILSHA